MVMTLPKLTKLELQIMEALWNQGACSIREIQEAFPERNRPAYTTVQTTVYRMENKKLLRRAKKISNAHIFEAIVSRQAAQGRLIDELLSLFGGRTRSEEHTSELQSRLHLVCRLLLEKKKNKRDHTIHHASNTI